ncbi:hypothetical protein PS2_024171 [Malus domestica]
MKGVAIAVVVVALVMLALVELGKAKVLCVEAVTVSSGIPYFTHGTSSPLGRMLPWCERSYMADSNHKQKHEACECIKEMNGNCNE